MPAVRQFISIFLAIFYLSAIGTILPMRYENPAYASSSPREEAIRRISTPAATLLLGFHGGSVHFAGKLPTAACTIWKLIIASPETTGGEDIVVFDLVPEELGGVCIQQLAREEQVSGTAPALQDTIYVIRLNGEVIFSGQIRENPRLI